MVKAVTLHEPYAWLIAYLEKEYETRSWATSYRGALVIHAGKSLEVLEETAEDLAYLRDDKREPPPNSYLHFLKLACRKHGIKRLIDLPIGAALCFVDLVDCIRMTDAFIAKQTPQERAFGHWAPMRYAWKLANVRRFDPIAIRGGQALWDWEEAYYKAYPNIPIEKEEAPKPKQLSMF